MQNYNTTTTSKRCTSVNAYDDFRCEDENYIYVLFDYIKGETVGEKNLTKEQITQLAEIVSQLHH